MPAFAPGETRRLTRDCRNTRAAVRSGAVLLIVASLAACGREDSSTTAARLDRRDGTHIYGWLLEHDPSRLDVAGAVPSDPQPFVPDGTIRRVAFEPLSACRQARRDRALLLIFVSARERARYDAARDCGFALESDAAALIIAPR